MSWSRVRCHLYDGGDWRRSQLPSSSGAVEFDPALPLTCTLLAGFSDPFSTSYSSSLLLFFHPSPPIPLHVILTIYILFSLFFSSSVVCSYPPNRPCSNIRPDEQRPLDRSAVSNTVPPPTASLLASVLLAFYRYSLHQPIRDIQLRKPTGSTGCHHWISGRSERRHVVTRACDFSIFWA